MKELGPRYQVVDEIARGGMGVVLLALRKEDGGARVSPVAVKQLHAHLVDNPDIVTAFVDEARIASRIVHPNVVTVLDVEVIGDELVIVMDYVEGVPLRDLVRAHERGLPIPVVRRILVDALNGLQAAHETVDERGGPLDVVHRDVSPHNLLVDVAGVTRVTDFGIAIATGRIASTKPDGAVKGKLQYLSPEQVFRKTIDRRTDVFAAGLVAWEALVGRKLFDAGTEGETLAMIVREPIDPPSVHRLDVPLALDEIILRALEREPERRFDSAYAFARAIEEEGPLATRREVQQLVLAAGGEVLTLRRQRLGSTAGATPITAPSVGQGLRARPAAVEDDDAPTRVAVPRSAPEADGAVGPAVVAQPTDRRRPARRGGSLSPLALFVVGGICVMSFMLALHSARSRVGAPPGDPAALPPATAPPPSEPTTTLAPIAPPEAADPAPPPAPIPPPAAPPAAARAAPVHRPQPHPAPRRTDAGRGRPFMPDDL